MKRFLFIHIPKTAGTSFRLGLEAAFDNDSVCKDYSESSDETSDEVLENIYRKKDFYAFHQEFKKKGYRFLSGHFGVKKYIHLFGAENSITFLRDPVKRIVSEYNHFAHYHGYEKDFQSFYSDKRFVNKQLNIFSGVPWPLVGFIGLTERYSESLIELKKSLNINVPELTVNIKKNLPANNVEISDADLKRVTELNKKEIGFYNIASAEFDKRVLLGSKYIHGMVGDIEGSRVNGWAFSHKSSISVALEIRLNGQPIATVHCHDYRQGLREFISIRSGYCGFSFTFEHLVIGDTLEFIALETGQPLINSPLVVNERNL